MNATELNKAFREVYLQMKDRAFVDVDDLIQKRQELESKRLDFLANKESKFSIDGHEALVRMLDMKKNGIIDKEHRGHYEDLLMVRRARVKYFYDNDLVA
jgi:hypothetical protein